MRTHAQAHDHAHAHAEGRAEELRKRVQAVRNEVARTVLMYHLQKKTRDPNRKYRQGRAEALHKRVRASPCAARMCTCTAHAARSCIGISLAVATACREQLHPCHVRCRRKSGLGQALAVCKRAGWDKPSPQKRATPQAHCLLRLHALTCGKCMCVAAR